MHTRAVQETGRCSGADGSVVYQHPVSQRPETTSENTAEALADYQRALCAAPLAAETQRTYYSKVRGYLTWLAAADDDIAEFLANMRGQTVFDECELLLFDIRSSHRDPDAVRRTIQDFQCKHRNIRVLPMDTGPGLYQIWNRAIEMSGAPLLTNANLDDRKAPDALEHHLAALRQHRQLDLVCAEILATDVPFQTWSANSAINTYFTNVDAGPHRRSWWLTRRGDGTPVSLVEFGLNDLFRYDEADQSVDSQNIPHCMPMWRASLHQRFGMFDQDRYGPIADWAFWIRCASGGARLGLLHQATRKSPAYTAAAARCPRPVTVPAGITARYPPAVEAAIYFCCLEALQNAAKHAGDRARITVTLRHDTRELVCEVTDDGTGFTSTSTSTSTGAGLANMADRIAAVGGQLRIDSAPGRGTTVRASAPAPGSTGPDTAGQPGV